MSRVVEESASPADQCCSHMAFGVGASVALAVLTALTMYKPAANIALPAPQVAMISEESGVVPAISPERARPPVRFANPFDRSEVFEFPPGTTRAEARRKVAQLLLDRANGRGGQRSPRVAAARSAEMTSR